MFVCVTSEGCKFLGRVLREREFLHAAIYEFREAVEDIHDVHVLNGSELGLLIISKQFD